jgi:DDE family transposase
MFMILIWLAFAVLIVAVLVRLSHANWAIGAPNQRKLVVRQQLGVRRRNSPMATECRQDSFDFGTVAGRAVVGAFDGGVISSDAGALLLGATDQAIGLVRRFAACFRDGRKRELVEHRIETLVGQRVLGIALGYEDLNDHDALRHDPVMAVLAGKLEARRRACAPVAGKSTLSRLEHAPS